MKTLVKTLILSIFISNLGFAQGDFISADELAKLSANKNTVIVCARKTEDYKVVHIKDAINIWHEDLYTSGSIKGMLKPSSELAKIFGDAGISNTNKIVIYDDGSGKYAGRMYWIFKYLGCQDVKILNGHLEAWKKGRKPITKNPTVLPSATFVANVKSSEIASMSEVKSGKHTLVDVRNSGEYKGTEGTTARKGHIPGAVNFDYNKILNTDGTLKSKVEIETMLKKEGITSDKSIILYCVTSVRAGVVYAALKSVLGYNNVKVYDGAFNEWIASASNKLDN